MSNILFETNEDVREQEREDRLVRPEVGVMGVKCIIGNWDKTVYVETKYGEFMWPEDQEAWRKEALAWEKENAHLNALMAGTVKEIFKD